MMTSDAKISSGIWHLPSVACL